MTFAANIRLIFLYKDIHDYDLLHDSLWSLPLNIYIYILELMTMMAMKQQ